MNVYLKELIIMKRRFTKPWFRETDFFLKNTKLAFGQNHGFVRGFQKNMENYVLGFFIKNIVSLIYLGITEYTYTV